MRTYQEAEAALVKSAQRLSASEVNAGVTEADTDKATSGAQRLSASEVNAEA